MSVETIKKPAMTDGSRAGAGANQALYDNQSIADSRLIVNAKDHLEFLHGDSHPSAYAHIWLKYADSNQKRFLHRKVGALDNWADLDDLRGKPDVYVGINPLYRPYRKNSNVSDINWIWVDLDKPEHAPYDWAYKTTLKVEADVFEKELLPLPNAQVSSGRGIWYLWNIEKVSSQHKNNLQTWRALMDHFVNVFRPYGADTGAKDEARLMRLAGSVNGHNGQMVSIQPIHWRKYTIEELTERYLSGFKKSRRGESTQKPAKAKEKPRKAPAGGRTIATLIQNRMSDIEDLVAIRGGLMNGHRNEAIFIYAIHALTSGYDLEEARQRVVQLNEIYSDPLSANEVTRTLKSAEEQIKTPGFKRHSNAKIIDKLAITEEEQRQLRTIIGKDEKRRRNTISKRKSRKGMSRAEREADNLKKKMQKVAELKKVIKENPNISNRQLAKIMGCSEGSIRNWKKLL